MVPLPENNSFFLNRDSTQFGAKFIL